MPHSLEIQLNLRHMPTSSTSLPYVSRRLWSGRILCQSLDIPTPQFPLCAYVGIFIGLAKSSNQPALNLCLVPHRPWSHITVDTPDEIHHSANPGLSYSGLWLPILGEGYGSEERCFFHLLCPGFLARLRYPSPPARPS